MTENNVVPYKNLNEVSPAPPPRPKILEGFDSEDLNKYNLHNSLWVINREKLYCWGDIVGYEITLPKIYQSFSRPGVGYAGRYGLFENLKLDLIQKPEQQNYIREYINRITDTMSSHERIESYLLTIAAIFPKGMGMYPPHGFIIRDVVLRETEHNLTRSNYYITTQFDETHATTLRTYGFDETTQDLNTSHTIDPYAAKRLT